MTIYRPGRFLLALSAAVAICVGTLVASLGQPQPAQAATSTSGNTWTYQMDDPTQDGLVIRGTTGTTNPLLIYDRLNQPIFGVGEDGGAKVYGDNLAVNRGDDIYHSQVTVSPSDPNSTVCVRTGQLWLGGTAGHLWRCEARYGGPLGWWQLL